MAIGTLKTPVRVAESYVPPGEEQRLFPNCPYFLSRDQVLSVWPQGLITHEKFSYNGSVWRLVKRTMGRGSVYMAVLDDTLTSNGGPAPLGSVAAGCVTPDTARAEGPYSVPLDAFSNSDVSDVTGATADITPAYGGHTSFHHAASMPPVAFNHGSFQQQPGSAHRTASGMQVPQLGGNSMRDRSGGYGMALTTCNPSGAMLMHTPSRGFSEGNMKFMTDLVTATDGATPLDRYKAFIRLYSDLARTRENMGLHSLTPAAPAEVTADPKWDSPDAEELIRRMVMVGECLAKFGTADLVDARNNSSRAITTKDYAKLLRMYLEGNGAVFRDSFIARLPLALQDDALTVRTLLQTRCETNDMLFNQLVKHVGQEPAAGGAMVFNNSSVSANPTNHMLAAPKTLVNTVSNAWSKADVKRRTQFGALGAVAVVALWVVKRKLFGGGGGGGGYGGRQRSRRGDREESEWGGSAGSRWSSRSRGSGDLASRLMDERSSAERMAVRYISSCQDELRRAQQNDSLLRSDWRLGPLRLAMPGSGSVPTGYEPVQTTYCSVGSYMNALDGGMPYVLPPTFSDRQSLGGGSPRGSPRESVGGPVQALEQA